MNQQEQLGQVATSTEQAQMRDLEWARSEAHRAWAAYRASWDRNYQWLAADRLKDAVAYLRKLEREQAVGMSDLIDWRVAIKDPPTVGAFVELGRENSHGRIELIDRLYWHPQNWNLIGMFWRPASHDAG